MKKMWLSVLVLVSLMTLAATAQARGGGSGILFTLNAFYNTDKTESQDIGGTATTAESKAAIYDVKLGYLGSSGFYWGGLYTSRSSDVGGSSTSGSATGASVGYVGSMGFYVMGHYILSATQGTNYKEGSGMQADLGYMTAINGSFIVGVELTYRSISYKKDETNTNLDHYKHDEVMPLLTLGYLF